jgi:hypothetical protein
MLREGEIVLGQGDRGGRGPQTNAAEGNAGPAPFRLTKVEHQRWLGRFPRHTLEPRTSANREMPTHSPLGTRVIKA